MLLCVNIKRIYRENSQNYAQIKVRNLASNEKFLQTYAYIGVTQKSPLDKNHLSE